MGDNVVTLNAGSSSVKFALFAVEPAWPRLVASGQVEGLGAAPRFHARFGAERRDEALGGAGHAEAIRFILEWIGGVFPGIEVGAIGHRVVHGGTRFSAPVLVDDGVLGQLREFIPLAPLHQPHNLTGLEAARAVFPGAPQIACFDTAFHRGHAFVDDAYALPRRFYERGLRRFGFHGLSYEFIARRMAEIDPQRAKGRVVAAHLGAGASLCAMRGGRSVATSMGFSALEGLPMGTRCGQIDPGLLLYLVEHDKMTAADLSHLLYHECGLLGLSGLSQDMRALEASGEPQAREAVEYFVHRVKMQICSLAATIGGLDALVFTAGIGEHSAHVRASVVEGLEWLGLKLDAAANARAAPLISDPQSEIAVYVVPTDEEAMIAYHAIATAGLGRGR